MPLHNRIDRRKEQSQTTIKRERPPLLLRLSYERHILHKPMTFASMKHASAYSAYSNYHCAYYNPMPEHQRGTGLLRDALAHVGVHRSILTLPRYLCCASSEAWGNRVRASLGQRRTATCRPRRLAPSLGVDASEVTHFRGTVSRRSVPGERLSLGHHEPGPS